MSSGKNRNKTREQFDDGFPPWYYWLSAHASTHGVIVYLCTGSITFLIVEFFSHWFIDLVKCDKLINLHQDQALHILTKVAFALFIFLFGLPV